MKKYIKPVINDEEIELEDIVAASSVDSTNINNNPNNLDGTTLFFPDN